MCFLFVFGLVYVGLFVEKVSMRLKEIWMILNLWADVFLFYISSLLATVKCPTEDPFSNCFSMACAKFVKSVQYRPSTGGTDSPVKKNHGMHAIRHPAGVLPTFQIQTSVGARSINDNQEKKSLIRRCFENRWNLTASVVFVAIA